MATSLTANLGLQKPSISDRNWDLPLNANADLLDRMSALGGLIVAPTEIPSASLKVRISPGKFRKSDGTFVDFPGTASLTLPAAATTRIWLTDAGQVATGAAFPASLHVPLAQVVTNATSIGTLTDGRVQCYAAGTANPYLSTSGGTVQGTFTVRSDAANKTVVQADPVANVLAFFGATPATQAATSASLVNQTGSAGGGTISDVGSTPSQATINANFAALAARVNVLLDTLKRFGLMSN